MCYYWMCARKSARHSDDSPTVFHNSSIFLPYWLATLVSFRETFQEEKLLTMKGSYKIPLGNRNRGGYRRHRRILVLARPQ